MFYSVLHAAFHIHTYQLGKSLTGGIILEKYLKILLTRSEWVIAV